MQQYLIIIVILIVVRNRNIAIGIGTRLRARRSGVRILAGERDFSILSVVHTGCHVGGGGGGGVKWPGRDTDHLLPFSVEVKNEWSYTTAPHMPS